MSSSQIAGREIVHILVEDYTVQKLDEPGSIAGRLSVASL
jgi:hypothetical protein